MTPRSLSCALLALSAACASVDEAPPREERASEQLARWMSGAFSSADQAAAQPEDFLDIRLFMAPIWRGRADGPWLYVEQASAAALERPYRQRVYRLVDEKGGARSDVYELPGDPLAFAGAWREPGRLDAIAPEALAPREGCSIQLWRAGELWLGSTQGEACASELRGASYATSEVTITPDTLTSWDRGFDAAGAQVWGATAGPYIFVKTRSL